MCIPIALHLQYMLTVLAYVYTYKSSVLPYAIDLLNGVISFEREKNLGCNVPIIDRRKCVEFLFLSCNNLIEQI